MKHSSSRSQTKKFILVVALALGASHLGQAAPVTTWLRGLGTNSTGLNTSNPVLGNGAANSANDQSIYAGIPAYTLANAGDSVSFSGSVTFGLTGNGAANTFRVGLYNVNGQSGLTGWLGYLEGNSAGSTAGTLVERNNPNSGNYYSQVTGATLIATGTASGNANLSSGNYTFSLTATRDASNGLAISWSLAGTGYSLSAAFTDPTPQTFTFDRVALTTVNGLNASEVSFSGLSVVPEPQTAMLLAIAFGFVFLVRRGSVMVRRRALLFS